MLYQICKGSNISTYVQIKTDLKYTIPKYTILQYQSRGLLLTSSLPCVLRVRLQRFVYNCDTPITQLRMQYYHIMHFI
jgi:hypothetical protein